MFCCASTRDDLEHHFLILACQCRNSLTYARNIKNYASSHFLALLHCNPKSSSTIHPQFLRKTFLGFFKSFTSAPYKHVIFEDTEKLLDKIFALILQEMNLQSLSTKKSTWQKFDLSSIFNYSIYVPYKFYNFTRK